MLEGWIAVIELVLKILDVDEIDLTLFSVDFHRLHSSILFENDLFNPNYFWIVDIREHNLLCVTSSELVNYA